MRYVLFALLVLLTPSGASALTQTEKAEIAKRLSETYNAISVTAVGSPVISGDADPAVFRISPSGRSGFGKLFLEGRYDVIYSPDNSFDLGSYFCTIASEFVRERRATKADFLPSFSATFGGKVKEIGFEIKVDRETIRAIVYALLTLWDFARQDYGKFEVLVRGHADRGSEFSRPLLKKYLFRTVPHFPLARSDDPIRAIYVRSLVAKQISDPYTNADLPYLRSMFMKGVIDRFLEECRLRDSLTPASFILEGSVVDVPAPEYRTLDIYFYAYR